MPLGRKSIGVLPVDMLGVQLTIAEAESIVIVSMPGVLRLKLTVPDTTVGVPAKACACALCSPPIVANIAPRAQESKRLRRLRAAQGAEPTSRGES